MTSNVTVNKVFGAFWDEKTSRKKQVEEESNSDSEVEEERKRKKKRLRKKKSNKQRKPKVQNTFQVRHKIPMESVTPESHKEILCIDMNFKPNEENTEELIAQTQFFNSRNSQRQTFNHVSPWHWPVVRALIYDEAPGTFNIHEEKKRSKKRPAMECVPRAHEEAYLEPPDLAAGERPCLLGNECEGLKIRYDNAFICKEFFLPSEEKKIRQTGKKPLEVHLCLLCKRNEIARALLNTRADRMSIKEGVTLQDYYNLVGIEGEYDIKNCICSDTTTYEGLLEPIVLHQQCAYRLVEENGKRRYQQWKMTYPTVNSSFH